MTAPRSQLVDPSTPGFYHCASRCVRRAFLCGVDHYTGRNFEHRKAWVEQRLFEIAEVFSVGVYAYAIMSNHLHVVLHVDPDAAQAWSDHEVARRWVRLCPVKDNGQVCPEACRAKVQVLCGNPERIAVLRERLCSLSWFMRCLSEPIARQANREDACTGRFWEGRFKCQALLDEAAILACMAYVDLNPIRAGMARELTDSAHTSVKRRIEKTDPADPPMSLAPIVGHYGIKAMPISTLEYLALVEWTGRIVRPDKRGAIDANTPSILRRFELNDLQWQTQVLGIESRYWRAVGAVDALIAKAKDIGQCWLKGGGVMRKLANTRAVHC